MKHKHYLIGAGILILGVVFCVPLLVGAAPGTPPPAGVTSATFNTVTSSQFKDKDNESYLLDPASTSYVNDMRASIYYDRDNTGYYLNPASTSYVNDMRASIYYDRDNTGYYTNPASTSNLNYLYANYAYSNVYYDKNNTAYYVDPGGISSMNVVRASQFYDREDLSYRVDPASISILNDVRANMFYDKGDPSYYVNPAGTSQMSNITASYLKDKDDVMYSIDPNGTSYLNSVWGNIFFDKGNAGYYVDPASTSNINALTLTGNVTDTNGSVVIDDSLDVNSWTSLYGGFNIYSGGIKNGIMDVSGNFRTKGVVTAGDSDLNLVTPATVTLSSSGIDLRGNLWDSSGNLTVVDTIDVTGSVISNGTVQGQGLVATNGLSATNYIMTSGYISTGGNILSNANIQAPSGNISAGTGFPSARVHGTGSTYGVWGSGSTMGGRFHDSNGVYSYVAYGGYGLQTSGRVNLNVGTTGQAILVNSAEALWDNGTYFSWGYGRSYNYFAGKVGIGDSYPSYKLELPNNSLYYYGSARAYSWITYSDTRVKKNQKPISYGLADVMKLQPKKYDHYAGDFENGKLELTEDFESTIGLVAQDVYEVVPELVDKPEDDSNELWSMDYERLTAVLVSALQELKVEKDKEVSELREEIKELRGIVCEIKPTSKACN